MQLVDLKWILEDYPLDVFVRTPNIISFSRQNLPQNMEQRFKDSAEIYLSSLFDLIANREYYARNEVQCVRQWLSKQIEATNALTNIMQLCEDMTNIFSSEVNWARALALRSIIEILNSMSQQLSILRNQTKSARFITRIRDKTYYVIAQKIPQIFNIVATMIAIELGQSSCSEIVSAIGKGVLVLESS